MTAHRAVWPALLTVVAMGCAEAEARRTFQVGPHGIGFVVLDGWTTIDQGQQIRLRRGDAEVVVRDLGALGLDATPPLEIAAVIDAGLAALGHDDRRDVKSRRPFALGGRDAFEIETWNRLAHTAPERMLLVVSAGHVLAVHARSLAPGDTARAFDRLRDTLQFGEADIRRR